MGKAIRRRKSDDRWMAGSVVKKAILPTFCFAALSTIAFEGTVHAAQTNTIVNQGVTKYVNISSGQLNLRAGASTSSAVIAGLTKGTAVTVYSEINGWAAVQVNGQSGYVSSLYLSSSNQNTGTNTTAAATTSTKYVNVTSGELNLRSDASTAASIIGSLTKGTAVTVYSEANGWSKVNVNGKDGYVNSSFLASTNPNASVTGNSTSTSASSLTSAQAASVTKYVNVSSGELNLRSSASTAASIIGSLTKGTAVTVYSEANGWSKVNVNGKDGYVNSSFLTFTTPNASATGTTTSTNTGTSASSSSSVQAAPVTKYVNVSSGSLNLRNAPSTTASIIVQLAKGTAVKVDSETNGWSQIEVYGNKGYVSSQYLSDSVPSSGNTTPVQQTVTKYVAVSQGSSLNIRSSASTSSTILAQLTNGTTVTVYSESNGWSKVQVNGQDGYVNSSFLTDTNPNQTSNANQQDSVTKYVNVDVGSSLNMRKYASSSSSVLVQLTRGLEVTVVSESNGWSEIEAYGQEGYVNSSYLSATKPTTGSDSTTTDTSVTNSGTPVEKYVNVIYGSSLNLRLEASSSASIVTQLARGTIVTVYSETNGWAKVTVNGQSGYVSAQYLSDAQPLKPSANNGIGVTDYESYNISLSDMTKIETAANPQTDKNYNTYIRADALTLTSPSIGTVNGSGWNVRGGAGTNYWVVGQVSNLDSLQILSKVTGSDGYVWYQVTYNKTWVNASPEDVSYYLDPNNFLSNQVDALQFLKLSESASLDPGEVNSRILAGKGSLQGMAGAFISAGNTYGVNEIYLISHALLETGNGSSQLANGVQVNGKTVYNMYGIGAVDSSPVSSGAQFAYNAGWFTPEAAIIGGAQFIAKEYIDAGQDTLYKMRWNPEAAVENGYATHQYATDIGWAEKQVNQIYNLYSLLDTYKLILDIPQYQ